MTLIQMQSDFYSDIWEDGLPFQGGIMYYVLDNGVVIGSYKYLKDASLASKGMYEIFYSLR